METEGHFPFLDLPPELRNIIYNLDFQDHIEYVTKMGPYCPPGILLANKRLHFEATSIFYASTKFYIGRRTPLNVFASLSTEFRDAITCVRIAADFSNNAQAEDTLLLFEAKNQAMQPKLRDDVLQVPLFHGTEMAWTTASGTTYMQSSKVARTDVDEWEWVLMRRYRVVREAEEQERNAK